MTRNPIHPAHPERVCWGCERYCRADDLICGSDTVRTPHPLELFGEDWDVEVEFLTRRAAASSGKQPD